MTKITFYKTKAGLYRGFKCDGHSGYARRGEDIVCAAVSVLVINTVNSLEQIAVEPMEVNADEESGTVECRFTAPKVGEAARVLLDSLALGLTRIADEYGNQYCRLTFEEV